MAFNDLRIDPFLKRSGRDNYDSTPALISRKLLAAGTIHSQRFSRSGSLALRAFLAEETIRHVILPLALRRMLPAAGQPVDH